jgi:signal transduction histidine kinase
VGQPTSILVPAELRHENVEMLERLKAGMRIAPYETIRMTKAGERLDVEVTMSPLLDAEGRLVGVAKILRDISNDKRAEKALSGVSRRLIDAQEQERSRIARELHDDIGQRLALLTVHLSALADRPGVESGVDARVAGLQQRASSIADDIQALSHRLHAPQLDLLGITAAARQLCAEFAEQQQAAVDFESQLLQDRLPRDLSLCLFRILQEALHNAAKHSGVRRFEVQLWTAQGQLHLLVSDRGKGFDVAAARSGYGLGLVSMEERIKLVGGELSIESQPNQGTTVHARVRLDPPDSAAAN